MRRRIYEEQGVLCLVDGVFSWCHLEDEIRHRDDGRPIYQYISCNNIVITSDRSGKIAENHVEDVEGHRASRNSQKDEFTSSERREDADSV